MGVAWRGLAMAAAAVAGVTMGACSLLVSSDEVQCATSDDCVARGPTFTSATCVANVCRVAGDAGTSVEPDASDPWGCLDENPSPSSMAAEVDVQIVLYNGFDSFTFGGSRDGGTDLTLLAYTPQPGVTVAACGALDPACASPVSGPTTSDDAGVARLMVPGAFTGFYSLAQDGSVPSFFYPGNRLLAGEPSVSFPTSETTETSFTELQAAFNIDVNQDVDAGPGTVSLTQYDCNDRHASGVAFTVAPAPAHTLYLANGLPSTTATQTSPDGVGVLVNVPAGGASITSTLVGQNNRVLGTANVLVRSGSLTLVYLRPRAR
jgi:hypothetical protein